MKWLLLLLLISPALSRDLDGKYAQQDPAMHSWFQGLHAKGSGVPCCDIADGKRVDDVDWQTKDGHYQVRLEGQWIDVPDQAVVTDPNKFGTAVVWPYNDWDVNDQNHIGIRCFMPGGGT